MIRKKISHAEKVRWVTTPGTDWNRRYYTEKEFHRNRTFLHWTLICKYLTRWQYATNLIPYSNYPILRSFFRKLHYFFDGLRMSPVGPELDQPTEPSDQTGHVRFSHLGVWPKPILRLLEVRTICEYRVGWERVSTRARSLLDPGNVTQYGFRKRFKRVSSYAFALNIHCLFQSNTETIVHDITWHSCQGKCNQDFFLKNKFLNFT